ncbi:MAG: hypothetical protein ACRDKG_12865 [Actinomycetota bacterium]
MTKRRLAALVLIIAAFALPLGIGQAQQLPTFCYAYSLGGQERICTFFSDGGIRIVALTAAHWKVTYGGNNGDQQTCGEGPGPAFVGGCTTGMGDRVVAHVTRGVIVVLN